ncbi:MAG: 4-hydroxy-tetrahydrodipicolinate reductase [Provencibacterium sp.]|jgi:4-hydroxy-tetrahydrodipicolinate reductase|nr:4-hydroxy-tetrahydrodipicolinate reductase [Provencibacterium sp.]
MNRIRIILSGAGGKMGRAIRALCSEREDCTIVAGFDLRAGGEAPFPIYPEPAQCTQEADVVIDFSHPSVLEPLLAYCRERKLPAVLATTGYSPEQLSAIQAAAADIPVFSTANMSLGVNLLASLCEKAAAVLGHDFDIEIIEKHHNQKIDAPSGTALMLADRISGALEKKPQYVYDRHSERRKRRREEIGLHAVRGGTIVGEHEVLFAGTDETITLSHAAYSKQVFAAGAINAALFLAGQPAGIYDMGDLV